MTTDASGAAPPKGAKRGGGGALHLASVAVRVGLAVVIIAAALGVFYVLKSTRPEITQGDDTVTPPLVDVVTVRRVPVARVWDGYGTARAMDAADLSAQVSARVVERPDAIEAGGAVSAGDLIVALDETDFRETRVGAAQRLAALESDLAGLDVEEISLGEQLELARGERDAARRDYERAQEALRRGAGSESEIDRRQTAMRAADRVVSALGQQLDLIPTRRASLSASIAAQRADLRVAEENLSRTRIEAPISGVLQSVTPEAGELLTIGAPVARVVDLSRVEVPLRLPVSASRSIGVGSAVTLRADSEGEDLWEGRVIRVAPEADASARTMTVFVEVRQDPGAPDLLLPGQFVVGRVSAREELPRVVVPRRAVEGDRVFLAVETGAHSETGARRASSVEAVGVRIEHAMEGSFGSIEPGETEWWVLAPSGDLAAGTRVIVSNLEQLRSGMIVEGRELGDGGGGSGPPSAGSDSGSAGGTTRGVRAGGGAP